MVKPRYTRELNLASKYPISISCIVLAQSQLQTSSFGEIGFYIIDSCLVRLFPPDAFLPGSTSPLSASDFRTFVLLPEVAIHLIMEDLGQDRATAIGTLLSSMKYGDSRFVLDPDNEYEYDQNISDACKTIHAIQSPKSCRGKEYDNTSGIGRHVGRKRKLLSEASVSTAREDVGEGLDDGPEMKRQRVARE